MSIHRHRGFDRTKRSTRGESSRCSLCTATYRLVSGSLVLTLAGSSTGCVFLLDFDELKGEEGTDAGSLGTATQVPTGFGGGAGQGGNGGDPSAAGHGGTGGAAGAETGGTGGTTDPCAAGCNDSDPCTTDTCTPDGCVFEPMVCESSDECVPSMCQDGTCVEVPMQGLVPYGAEERVTTQEIYRTDLVAAGGRFFSAVYGRFGENGTPNVRLSAVDAVGSATAAGQTLTFRDGSEVGSPPALVADTRNGFELNLFVAVRRPVGSVEPSDAGGTPVFGSLGDVLRIRFTADLQLSSTSAQSLGPAPSYRFLSDHWGPAAGQLPGPDGSAAGGEPFVAWPAQDSTNTVGLYVQGGDPSTVTPSFIPVAQPLSGLAALSTSSGVAGAAWMTDSPTGGVSVFAGSTSGDAPLEISQCGPDPAFRGYDLQVSQTLGSLWTLVWNKQSDTGFATENTVIDCAGTSCADPAGASACTDADIAARVRVGLQHLEVQSYALPDDPGFLYQAIAVVAPQSTDTVLGLVVNRIDVDNADGLTEEENLGQAEVALGSGAGAPSWPVLAISPPDRMAISWIESTGSGDVARLQRYRLCR